MVDDKFKICCGFVTYNPDGLFHDRIAEIVRAGIDCYIFDNSPEAGGPAPIGDAVRYHHKSEENAGLAKGINHLCRKALSDGFDGLLLFDQDTVFTTGTIDFVDTALAGFSTFEDVFSINFTSKERPIEYAYSMLNINSGKLYILENLEKIGWHDERYFVDCVDYEICLKARTNGLKMLTFFNTPGFDHYSNQDSETALFLGKRVFLYRRYPPRRIRDTLLRCMDLLKRSAAAGDPRFFSKVLSFFILYAFFQLAAFLTIRVVCHSKLTR